MFNAAGALTELGRYAADQDDLRLRVRQWLAHDLLRKRPRGPRRRIEHPTFGVAEGAVFIIGMLESGPQLHSAQGVAGLFFLEPREPSPEAPAYFGYEIMGLIESAVHEPNPQRPPADAVMVIRRDLAAVQFSDPATREVYQRRYGTGPNPDPDSAARHAVVPGGLILKVAAFVLASQQEAERLGVQIDSFSTFAALEALRHRAATSFGSGGGASGSEKTKAAEDVASSTAFNNVPASELAPVTGANSISLPPLEATAESRDGGLLRDLMESPSYGRRRYDPPARAFA